MTNAMTRDPIYYKELAREDLGRYREALKDIQETKNKIIRLETRATRMTQQLNPNKVQVQAPNNGPEDLFAEIADTRSLYWHDCVLSERICREIEIKIGQIESQIHRKVLSSYWLYGKRLKQIAIDEHYGYSTIKRYHREALEEYGKKLAPDGPLHVRK